MTPTPTPAPGGATPAEEPEPELLYIETKRSDTIGQLALALSKAQGAMGGAKRDAQNPHFKSKFASLSSVWEACREALSTNELAVYQAVATRGRTVIVTTLLAHSSNEWIEQQLAMKAATDTPQAVGSTTTYARRYALAAAAGVAPEDDDGNAGSNTLGGVRQSPGTGPLQQPRVAQTDELTDKPPQPALPSASTPATPRPVAQAAPVAAPIARTGGPPPPGKPPMKAPGA